MSARSTAGEVTLPASFPDTMRRAADGERDALAEIYGMAAAFTRSGVPVPEPLASWIAARMQGVAQALMERADKDVDRDLPKALLGALAIVRPTATRRAETKGLELAQDVLHFMQTEGLKPHPAMQRVMEWRDQMNRAMGTRHKGPRFPPADIKTIEAAWKKHGKALLAES